MKKRIISIMTALTTLVTLFTGFTCVRADLDNDSRLITYAANSVQWFTPSFHNKKYQSDDLRYLLADITGDGVNELIVIGVIDDDLVDTEIFKVTEGGIEKILEDSMEYYGGSRFYYVTYEGKPYIVAENFKNETKHIGLLSEPGYHFEEVGGIPIDDTYTWTINDVLTFDELYSTMTEGYNKVYEGDNDTALKAFARDGLNILHLDNILFFTTLDRASMRYLLTDVTDDGNNELIVVDSDYYEFAVFTNDNGNIKQIFSGNVNFDAEEPGYGYYWITLKDKNYHLGCVYGVGENEVHTSLNKLSQTGTLQSLFEADGYDVYYGGKPTYYLDGKPCTKEEYEEKVSYATDENYRIYDIDFMTLDELLRGETPIKIYVYEDRIHPDAAPVIVDGRTLVPIRAVAEALGYEVGWNQAEQRVTLSSDDTGKSVSVVIGDYSINTANKTVAIDVPAQILNDRTYIPLRAVTEALDCAVEWNGDERAVYIK